MNAFKFLRSDGTGLFTGFRWSQPGGEPGAWVDADVDPCRSGIHACRVHDLPLWLSRSLYEIELDGHIVEEASKVVAARGRLLRRIDAWDEQAYADYTRMCADRAHELAQGARLDEWEVVIEPSIAEGGALLGFIAARIAEAIEGEDAYRRERAGQAQWLVERLGLTA